MVTQTSAQKEAAQNRAAAEYKLSITGRYVSNEEAQAAVSFGAGIPGTAEDKAKQAAILEYALNQNGKNRGLGGSSGNVTYVNTGNLSTQQKQELESGARQRLNNLYAQPISGNLSQQTSKQQKIFNPTSNPMTGISGGGLSSQFDTSTNQSKAKTPSYWQNIKQSGPITGTFNYISEKAKPFVSNQPVNFFDLPGYMQKGTTMAVPEFISAPIKERKSYAAQEAIKPALITTSLFTPAASVVLVGGGIESYAFSANRKELADTSLNLQSKGLGKTTSDIISWGTPAAEIALGGWLGKSQIKNFGISRELKALKNAPVKVVGFQLEGEKGGLQLLRSEIKAGKATYTSDLIQPFYQTEKGAIFEGGIGRSTRLKGSDLSIVKFESGGKVTSIDTMPKLIGKNNLGLDISKSLPDYQANAGRFYIKPTARADLKLAEMPNWKGGFNLEATGKITNLPGTSKYQNFLSIGKTNEKDIIGIMGGTPNKLRYNVVNDVLSLRTKPDTFGFIKRLSPGDFGTSNLNLGGTTTSTKSITGFSQQAIKESFKSLIPAKTSTGLRSITGLTSFNIPKRTSSFTAFQIPQVKQKDVVTPSTFSKTIDILETPQKTKQNTAYFPVSKSGLISLPRERTNQIPRLGQPQIPIIGNPTRTRTPEVPTLLTPGIPLTPFIPSYPVIPIIPILPKLNLFDYGRGRKSKQKGFKGRYAPDISSIGLGIYANKIPKSYLQGAGALSLRPQIIRHKKSNTKARRKRSSFANNMNFLNRLSKGI